MGYQYINDNGSPCGTTFETSAAVSIAQIGAQNKITNHIKNHKYCVNLLAYSRFGILVIVNENILYRWGFKLPFALAEES